MARAIRGVSTSGSVAAGDPGVSSWSVAEAAETVGPAARKVLVVGDLAIDLLAHRLTVNGDRVRVTPMQMRLLVHLIEHRDEVVTRGDLLKQVWGYQQEIQTRTVDIHVQRLRERLGSAARLITTVRGIGYRLSEDPE
jgi:two-component system, OmpR family, phosphate regulon response regulator PhoB